MSRKLDEVTPSDLARALGVSPRTVLAWISACVDGARSPLKASDFRDEEPNGERSRRYFIDRKALDRLVRAKITKPARAAITDTTSPS